jgi:hypothetical protein
MLQLLVHIADSSLLHSWVTVYITFVLQPLGSSFVQTGQGTFPMGTTGNGVSILISAAGKPFPRLF